MTNEEAIKEFEYCIEENQGFMECRYASKEAYQTAIKALEKQIPKKPIKIIDDSGDTPFNSWECPVCGSDYLGDFGCGDCGQAIDWSDTE